MDNALQTINTISDFDEDAKINLVLNKCSSFNFNDIKYKFKLLFGSESIDYHQDTKNFRDKIQNLNYVTETDLSDIISSNINILLLMLT